MVKHKKGQAITFGNAPVLAIQLVVLFVVVISGVLLLSNLKTSFTSQSEEELAANNSIIGLGKITDQASNIGLIFAIGLVLSIVIGVFAFVQRGR